MVGMVVLPLGGISWMQPIGGILTLKPIGVKRERASHRSQPIHSGPMPDTMPVPSSLTIVLPAYNEANRIGPALDELFAYLSTPHEGLPPAIDVLLVDDGSTDSTTDVIRARPEFERATGAPLRLLQVAHGGKGAAVKAGMLAAQGDLVVFADA